MAANKSKSGDNGYYLKKKDVVQIGKVCVDLATRYPRTMGTERQLAPAVLAILQFIDPKSTIEWNVESGRIDFKTSGTNPSFLELVVAPKKLGPGDQANQLSPSQNEDEIRKLSSDNAKSRNLLLIDLDRDDRDFEPSYRRWAAKNGLTEKIRVVTVRRDGEAKSFNLK